jgi:hypothetical protein
LDHSLRLKRVVAGRPGEKKEEVRTGCLQRQGRIERDFEYDDGDDDECAVVGMD